MRIEEAWRVLGLPARPSALAVKIAFRRLAKSTHPDAIGGGEATTLQFARITEAYDVALADAIAAGRLVGPGRGQPPARPAPATRRAAQPPRSKSGAQPTASARPGSTTYDGATEEEPVWDGAAWVGADSGTYWTVNPREYADFASMAPSIEPEENDLFGERRANARKRNLLRDLRELGHVVWLDPPLSPLAPPRSFSLRCW